MWIARIMVAALGADGVSSRMMSCRFGSKVTVVRFVASAMAFAAAAICTQATVQAQTRYNFKYSEALDAGAKIDSLGNDLFGDSISYADGGVEFSVVDVAAKTNHSLPVQFGRSMRPVRSGGGSAQYGRPDYSKEILGQDWIPDVPVISGVYPRNSEFAVGANRCTRGSMAPQPIPAYGQPPIFAFNFWHGTTVSIPGGGQHSILGVLPETPMPTDGKTYLYTAAGDWRIACLNSTKNNAGQGFEVLLPDGSRYYFDWVARAADVGLRIPVGGAVGVLGVDRDKFSIYATRAVDRFGNSVDYTYDPANPHRLLSIVSSDGAAISVAYGVDGRVSSVTNNGRVWTYAYTQEDGNPYIFRLSQVVLPDASKWTYEYINRMFGHNSEAGSWHEQCEYNAGTMTSQGNGPTGQFRAIHPSGAVGTFTFKTIVHGYNNVPFGGCYFDPSGQGTVQSGRPHATPLNSLISKKIEGPGLTPITWDIAYSPTWSWQSQCASGCPTTATTIVSRNDGVREEYVFGNDFLSNANQILSHKTYGGSQLLKSVSYAYAATQSGYYPQYKGRIGLGGAGDTPADSLENPIHRRNHPQTSIITTQDGSSFARTSAQFDVFVRPIDAVSSGPSGTQTLGFEFHDSLSLWVLGQRKKVVFNGVVKEEINFDGSSRPTSFMEYGRLRQSLTYNADGTVATVKDGNNNVTTLSGWKRGIPQEVQYAATPESPSGAIRSAVVNDLGLIEMVRDEAGYPTCYQYDQMGRVSRVTHPSKGKILPVVCGTDEWNPTTLDFEQVAVAEYGIPAGHWRQTVSTGNARKISYFDALWRPLLTKELDATDSTTESLTKRFQRFTYDHDGRVTYASYLGAVDTLTTGIWTEYDALGRTRTVSRDSEHGPLTTIIEYLTGFKTRVTNPRGQQTLTIYQAFDQPTYEFPAGISELGGDRHTEIYRDVFGKVTALRRRNGDASTQLWRHYVYDAHQQLCKTVEPETGATIMDYDGAGNLQWSASGLHHLMGTTGCDTIAGRDSGRKVTRTYDGRNRLHQLLFPIGVGDQLWSYTPDGLPSQVTTWNETGGHAAIVNDYVYNRRRMLIGESIHLPNWYVWGLGYGYDANGSLASQTYPTGLAITYAPNALGQATQARDQSGHYDASGAIYYPNGAIKQFTYGNGIVHAMAQNVRQLPVSVVDAGVSDLTSYFDANGNVTDIYDVARGSFYNRHMQYDGLDRLTAAGSWVFGGDAWHRCTYDALDNMKSWKLPGVKDYAEYVYDARNQLGSIKNSSGATIAGFGYDLQGNLANKNGSPYSFDYGNRLREAYGPTGAAGGPEWYRYDAQGRRVHAWGSSLNLIASQYSQSGQILYAEDYRAGKNLEHIYLAGSVIAIREWSHAAQSSSTKFQHTDALGSPVAVTNQAGTVIERNDYEPYGAIIGKPTYQGIGYTGHVQDAATGLTYMQQRYYDPQVGLFLSVDPVTAYSNPVGMFNRYRYATNNPYRFTDPDGRQSREIAYEFQRSGWTPPPSDVTLADVIDKTAKFINPFMPAAECYRDGCGKGGWAMAAVGAIPLEGKGAQVGMRGLLWIGGSGKGVISFGKNANQISHAFRHVIDRGMDVRQVATRVARDVNKIGESIDAGQTVNRSLTVGGQKLEYTVHKLDDGTLRVGTIAIERRRLKE